MVRKSISLLCIFLACALIVVSCKPYASIDDVDSTKAVRVWKIGGVYSFLTNDYFKSLNVDFRAGGWGSAQGACIHDNYLFQFYLGGVLGIYKLFDSFEDATLIRFMAMPSSTWQSIENPYFNNAVFTHAQNEGEEFPYIYVTDGKNDVFVLKVTLNSVTVLQRIDISSIAKEMNAIGQAFIVDEKGFMYIEGISSTSEYILHLRIIPLAEENVIVTMEDVIDSFVFNTSYVFAESDFQGAFKNGDSIYSIYGQSRKKGDNTINQIKIINVPHQCVDTTYNLNGIIDVEPQSINLWNDMFFITTHGVGDSYAIEL